MDKRGRPAKEDGKTKTLKVRLTDSEEEKLLYLSMETGRTKSEIIRDGLKMVYNLQRFVLNVVGTKSPL